MAATKAAVNKQNTEKETKAAAVTNKTAATELTKVKARALYFDVALNRLVDTGELFDVNAERLELLTGLKLVEKV